MRKGCGRRRALRARREEWEGEELTSRLCEQEFSVTRDPAIRDQKLISLLLTICRRLGYKKVEESTVKNVLFLGRKP
ncbi:hypothetical protein KAX17_02875 [Candidatus Bipolaricaulota bacterium]|nr:hypothetical protein [Candidatus Bipolaricaulota bacterium]